jgi:hypothetical protein
VYRRRRPARKPSRRLGPGGPCNDATLLEHVKKAISERRFTGEGYHKQANIAFLGIEASPSFVRQLEGNRVAERFIRTLKENLLWVRSFQTIEELRLALRGSPRGTTLTGWSPVMATGHQLRSGSTSRPPAWAA